MSPIRFIATYWSRFRFEIEGKEYKCLNGPSINANNMPETLKGYYDITGDLTCLLDVEKPGKYKMKVKWDFQIPRDPKKGSYAPLFDMVVGV